MFSSSRRLDAVQEPIIPVVARMVRQYPGTITLGQGVVHYSPPDAAIEAARRFGNEPVQHRYGSAQGQPDLLEQIRHKLQTDNGLRLTDDWRVMVTAGANMAFLNALLAIADPGDEIILPLPYYFNQEMAARMIGCVPVGVATRPDFHLDLDALRSAITPQTRAIVTVSPNNPTGAVYSESDLRFVNALCRDHGLFHVCDEAYEYFTWDGLRHFSPASIEGAESHTIALYSLSKAYGMASWRIGYMVYPAQLESAVLKVHDTNLICAPGISQTVASVAMAAGKDWCRPYLENLEKVRDMVLEELQAVHHACGPLRSEGAFYALLRVDSRLDSLTLVERLIRDYGVAVIPGKAFGLDDGCYLRVAYGALEEATARAGIRRLTRGLNEMDLGERIGYPANH